ncbi:tetratricopeptide repeat protein [Candidatus Cardinium sp. TP]|uniref:tetratricopeptide repeat protein n=1 Tax=Candidatus Cardinium sp. TP TaxID=2961955 RepID=UPI0021B02E19|nr:tetratricopeptide repeat protein [Candidatus Cardinium sp. TP]MCT4697443.1 tetratricopeptide repeat protein [Candidatus Cardinium sp. TP]MDN5246748.1 tetratricopeptide repeat protein [Candidatus Cardinium sp.]
MYTFCFLLIFLVIPPSLFAIPPSIARIVRTFEGQNKQKGVKSKPDQVTVGSGDGAANDTQPAEPSLLSNAQQARLAIDEAIKNSKLVNHPATWYYRGVIYDRLVRDHIAEPSTVSILLDEALAAYAQAKRLSVSKSKQFYSFTLNNLAALWSYFLNRGIGYYRQEAVEQALAQFAICKRILPEEPTPLLYTAIVYHSVDQPEAALRYYQDYVAVHGPHFAVARAMAAIHYHKLKNFDKAIAILKEALLQFPFHNELLEEKCLIYDASRSIDDYSASLKVGLQDKKIDAYYAYAYLLEHQGRIQEATGYYQQLLKECPHQYDTFRQVGFIFYNEAIKLYTHALKSNRQKEQYAYSPLVESFGLMHVMMQHLWLHTIWRNSALPRGFLSKEPPFSVRPIWVVYAHPLVQDSSASGLVHLLQAGKVPCTSPLYGYIHRKIATAWANNRLVQTATALEKYLQQALYYLKMAYRQNTKDHKVAQALYYSYYHLKKYRAANKLLQVIQKQKYPLEDDPFVGHQDPGIMD